MPECPVCRREFDARFGVFAGTGGESYDRVECARRAAGSAGAQEIVPPALLPTIELLPLARPTAAAPLATSRRRLAAAFAIPFAASPAAVAAGLSLVAVGTTTSLALWSSSLDGNGKSVVTAAAAAPTAPLSEVAPPARTSEPGDARDGKQPPESSAREADQGVSGNGLNSFAGSDAPEHPQIGGDSDLGNDEPSPDVPSSAPPSHTTPLPEPGPPRPPKPVPVSPGEPVTPAGPDVTPAGPQTPAGPLSPSLPGTPPSSPEGEAPPPPSPDDPSQPPIAPPPPPPIAPPPAPLWSTPSAPPTAPPMAPPAAAPPPAAPGP